MNTPLLEKLYEKYDAVIFGVAHDSFKDIQLDEIFKLSKNTIGNLNSFDDNLKLYLGFLRSFETIPFIPIIFSAVPSVFARLSV